jgi:hypothetical protein
VNVSVDDLHRSLEERMRLGRTPLEAAGEEHWWADLELARQLLSNQIHQETIQIVDEWLATYMNASPDEVGPYAMLAARYARFLAERVNIDSADAIGRFEEAWREWRTTRRGV